MGKSTKKKQSKAEEKYNQYKNDLKNHTNKSKYKEEYKHKKTKKKIKKKLYFCSLRFDCKNYSPKEMSVSCGNYLENIFDNCLNFKKKDIPIISITPKEIIKKIEKEIEKKEDKKEKKIILNFKRNIEI